MVVLLLAGGQPEGRPRSAAVYAEAVISEATLPDSAADSRIEVTVSRNDCVAVPSRTPGPNVMVTVVNEDRLAAVVTIEFVRTPLVEGESTSTVTLPLRKGRLELECSLVPLGRLTPVIQARTLLEVS